jgi:histidinol-phosphate phosphatase family protein
MSRPAVFFDRDNTLIANSDYLGEPERVVLLVGAAQAVARSRRLGFATVVVSNQSGVARGMFTEDDVRAVNAKMDAMLLAEDPDAAIDLHEFCPYHPDGTVEAYVGDHERRKPKPGMFFDAAKTLDLDLKKSWLIGDAPRDIEAGRRAGCRTILLRAALDSESPAASEKLRHQPDYTATSLQDAVDFIEMQMESEAAPLHVSDSVRTETTAIAQMLPSEPPAASPAPSTTFSHASDREQVVMLERILDEIRRGNDPQQDFSIARMLAGIMQGFALATFFAALLYRDTPPTFNMIILVAIFLQALVCGLVLLGR